MLICHVITDLGSGGAERMLTRIAVNDSAGVEDHMVVSLLGEGSYGAVLRQAGVELHCLGMKNGLALMSGFCRFVGLLRQKRPDVIMTWLYHADLFGTLCSLLVRRGTRRLVWNVRCSEVEFANYSRSLRWIVGLLSRLSTLPCVVAVNSHAGRRAHTALGYRPGSWAYLPNGVDLDEWRPDKSARNRVRKEYGFPDSAIIFGMVARVDPQKNHEMFLAVAQRLMAKRPNIYLFLIGEGTDRLDIPEELEERVVAIGLRTDVPNLIRALDVHVLSSSFGEGFPNVVCEAMASGVPCIVTDVGDAAKLVGETGLIIPPKNPEALAEAMQRLADEPPAKRRTRGKSARTYIRQRFDIKIVRGIYSDLWKSITSAG